MLKAQRAANEPLPEDQITEIDDELSEFDTTEPAANDQEAFADDGFEDADAPDEALVDDDLEPDALLSDELDGDESDFLPDMSEADFEGARSDIRRALEDRMEAKRLSSDFDYLDID